MHHDNLRIIISKKKAERIRRKKNHFNHIPLVPIFYSSPTQHIKYENKKDEQLNDVSNMFVKMKKIHRLLTIKIELPSKKAHKTNQKTIKHSINYL